MPLLSLGALATLLGVGITAVAFSQIIHWVSLTVGVVTAIGAYMFLSSRELPDVFTRDIYDNALHVALGIVFGFLAYRMFAGLIVIAGVGVAFLLAAVYLVGGTVLIAQFAVSGLDIALDG